MESLSQVCMPKSICQKGMLSAIKSLVQVGLPTIIGQNGMIN
jgi:hypothetical protein